MTLSRKAFAVCVLLFVYCSSHILRTSLAHAINGPQLIGFSAESTVWADSGHGVIADISAINTNPGALSFIQGIRFDIIGGSLQAFLRHSDVLGNSHVAGQNNGYALGHLGVATRFPFVRGLPVGAGIFAQGGFWTDCRNHLTACGIRDETSSCFRYLKFAITLNHEATEKPSIRVAPGIGYFDISLRLFPGTSVLPSPGLLNGFAGLDIRDRCVWNGGLGGLADQCPSDIVVGVKVGVRYRVLLWLTPGATYTSSVSFKGTKDQPALNFPVFGLGRVTYDAEVSGLKWSQQGDVSMVVRPMEQFLVALTTGWIDWASFHTIEITATLPNNPLPPSQANLHVPFTVKDHVVLGLGLTYAVTQEPSWRDRDRRVLKIGDNDINNPVPNETLSPFAPLILDHTLQADLSFVYGATVVRFGPCIWGKEFCDLHQLVAALRSKRNRIREGVLHL